MPCYYHVVAEDPDEDGTNYFTWRRDGTGDTGQYDGATYGFDYTNDWSWSSNGARDLLFKVWLIESAADDSTPPEVTLGTNNTSPKINSNISIYVNSTEAGNCWLYDNMSGTNTSSVTCNATFTYVVNVSQSNNILFNAYAEDSSSNLNDTETLTVTVANTAPPSVTTFDVTDGRRVNSNETIGWTAVTDADSDTVYYYVYFNESGAWYLHTNGTANSFVLNLTNEKTYNYKVATYDNQAWGSNSSAYTVELDLTAPVIDSWTTPGYSYPYRTVNHYFYVNITCSDTNELWSLNISLINKTSNILLSSLYAENLSTALFSNATNFTLPGSNDDYNITARCYDAHTHGEDILNYSYTNGELTFYDIRNAADNYKVEFGYYHNGEIKKITSQQIQNYNVKPYLWKYKGDYNFGALFDNPDAYFRFGFRFPDVPSVKLLHPETAHYIIRNKYYADFDAMVCEYDGGLQNCVFANPNIITLNGYNYIYYSLIDPFGDAPPYSDDLRDYFDVGARLVYFTKSTGALNVIEESITLWQYDPPYYEDLSNNASTVTYINGDVTINVTAKHEKGLNAEKWQIIRHNATGTWQEFNETQSGIQTQYISKVITPAIAHSYVCANFSLYAIYAAVNHTDMTCFSVQNSVPTKPGLLLPSNGSTQYDNTTTFDWADSTDADSDTITYLGKECLDYSTGYFLLKVLSIAIMTFAKKTNRRTPTKAKM